VELKAQSSMEPKTESKNIVAVRQLYEARGNPDIVKNLLAPDVRWEVVEGFPYSGVYQGLNGVSDFFMRLSGDFEDWHTEPAEIFEAGDRVIGLGFYSARAKATGKFFKARFAHVWTMRDGVIVRLQQCADTVQIARALEP
jgi:ketosteroid isomerase-like protein